MTQYYEEGHTFLPLNEPSLTELASVQQSEPSIGLSAFLLSLETQETSTQVTPMDLDPPN